MKRLDDFSDTATRAEAATSLTLTAAKRDLETCIDINEDIAFDTDTIRSVLDKAEGIATAVGELRCDMEGHVRATGHAWLDEA